MTVGFATFIGLLVLLIGATLLVTLLPKQDAQAGLGTASQQLQLTTPYSSWLSFLLFSSTLRTDVRKLMWIRFVIEYSLSNCMPYI